MADPISDITLYISSVDTNVTTKTAVDSIDPIDVGGIGTDLANLLLPYLQSINNQGYYQGTSNPSPLLGSDLDLYYQQNTAGFSVWRKQNGVWVLLITMSFIVIADGILSGLRTFIEGFVATVSTGTWSISGVSFTKAVQTQFTVPAADSNWLRYDLIYADDNGDIGYTTGVASSSPSKPVPSAGQLEVDYVVVPSASSGNPPYLLSGGSGSASGTASAFYIDETASFWSASGGGVITIPDVQSSFPALAQGGVIRANGSVEIGGAWYEFDLQPVTTRNVNGDILTAVFNLSQDGVITKMRAKIS